ncbi:hypothetical protein VIBNIFTn2_120149 [Vibrio nigripulchritudo FTn2]|uniref:hypothetical protein n=1 Tax=Vibrio nigripulchritudo TaxID=28173 RepID=UPI0003B20288|nr:hypothetical protein [Vibrio nigripulchritudo]CCN40167.1 hypothetical protein VIBNIFTn2_120149 [Vibrio nigripulchritudo FTn2]
MFNRLDQIAKQGFLYAIGEKHDCLIETEMELLAFNAGITDANKRHGLSVDRMTGIPKIYVSGEKTNRNPVKICSL